MEGLAYEDIPYISSDLKLPGSQDDRAYLYEVTDESKSIGDICKYLTDKGWAPGSSQGTKWRMPTANESRIVKYLMRVGTWGKRYEAENIDGTSVDPNTCYLNREGVHFPVSGYLNKDGDMGTQYPGVAYGSWTSTGNAARSTFWLSNSFLLHDVYDHYRSAAAIIRCVKE